MHLHEAGGEHRFLLHMEVIDFLLRQKLNSIRHPEEQRTELKVPLIPFVPMPPTYVQGDSESESDSSILTENESDELFPDFDITDPFES